MQGMENFAVDKPNEELGADACSHAFKRVRGSVVCRALHIKLPVLTISKEIRELRYDIMCYCLLTYAIIYTITYI